MSKVIDTFKNKKSLYWTTYLWNLEEYAKSDASPRPELSDVKTTPESAITVESA